MTDEQIQCWLERLREYHGDEKLELIFSFDDGQEVRHIAKEAEQ
jgi:hypothetical protein